MRMRYRYVTCRYQEGSQKQLELHYRQLLHDVLHQSQLNTWRPLTDILESPRLIKVRVELAGMQEEDIEVTLYEDALVISGERRDSQEHQEGLNYHEAQIRYGPFRVEVFILGPVMQDAVTARYENGMLLVDLPKLPPTQPKRVHLHQASSLE
jgi:HSP20 family protein